MMTYSNENLECIKRVIERIDKFRFVYYCLKYKDRFRKWLWINIREKKAIQKYAPENLAKLLNNLNNEEEIEIVIDDWSYS
jgi:hypothetical protein